MMQYLRDGWILLFQEAKHTIAMNKSPPHIICVYRIIIDDILLFSIHVPIILHYYSCVVRVFTKYRLSFKLSKYDLFQSRVEYVSRDIFAHINFPAV